MQPTVRGSRPLRQLMHTSLQEMWHCRLQEVQAAMQSTAGGHTRRIG